MEKPNLRGLKSSARLETRGTHLFTNTDLILVKTIQPSLFLHISKSSSPWQDPEKYNEWEKMLHNTLGHA